MSDVILYQILRAKAGEASGVAALSPRTKSIVRPMFDFPHIDKADGGGDQLSMFMTTIARSDARRGANAPSKISNVEVQVRSAIRPPNRQARESPCAGKDSSHH